MKQPSAIGETIKNDKVTSVELKEFLLHNIAEFTVCDETPASKEFEIGDIFIFALSRVEETLENKNEDIAACQIWTLPSKKIPRSMGGTPHGARSETKFTSLFTQLNVLCRAASGVAFNQLEQGDPVAWTSRDGEDFTVQGFFN